MNYTSAAAIVALCVVALAAFHTVSQMLRAHARERSLMLNQLLHLAGRTWEPPPADVPALDYGLDLDAEAERFTSAPTQLPNY